MQIEGYRWKTGTTRKQTTRAKQQEEAAFHDVTEKQRLDGRYKTTQHLVGGCGVIDCRGEKKNKADA